MNEIVNWNDLFDDSLLVVIVEQKTELVSWKCNIHLVSQIIAD